MSSAISSTASVSDARAAADHPRGWVTRESKGPDILYLTGSRLRDMSWQSRWQSDRSLRVVAAPPMDESMSLDDMRALVFDPLREDDEEFFELDVGAICRPWGRTRRDRVDGASPNNVRDMRRVLGSSRGRYPTGGPSGLWFLPGWTIASSLAPRYTSMPRDADVYVVEVSGYGGSGFRPGLDWSMPLNHAVNSYSLAGASGDVAVLAVATSAYAPRVVRPGLVLGASVMTRGDRGWTDTGREASETLLRTYLGATLMAYSRSSLALSLNGESMKDPLDVDRAMIHDMVVGG